jgi:hypothetical protein
MVEKMSIFHYIAKSLASCLISSRFTGGSLVNSFQLPSSHPAIQAGYTQKDKDNVLDPFHCLVLPLGVRAGPALVPT